MHALVGLVDADGVDLSQTHKLGEDAKNRFHGTLPFAFHIPALWAVHPFVVALVLRSVVGHTELLLLGALAKARSPYGAARTHFFAGTVFLFLGTGTVIVEHFGKGDDLALGANIVVVYIDVGKPVGAALIGAMGRYETFKSPFLQKGIVHTATVTGVRHAVLPYKALLPQAAVQTFDDIPKLLIVLPVGMVGPDICNHMVCRIHAQL